MKSKISLIKLVFILMLSILIAGCKLDFRLPANETMHLVIYTPGHAIMEKDVKATDLLPQVINRWLAANSTDWEYGFITRSPHIYLKGQNFSVNILENEVTVKYCRAFYNCHYWVKKSNGLFDEVQKIISTKQQKLK